MIEVDVYYDGNKPVSFELKAPKHVSTQAKRSFMKFVKKAAAQLATNEILADNE